MPDYRFHSSRHEALRVVERALSLENMKNVIRYPDRSADLKRGKKGGIVKKFWKTVDQRTLVVVAEIKDTDCWIITAYHES